MQLHPGFMACELSLSQESVQSSVWSLFFSFLLFRAVLTKTVILLDVSSPICLILCYPFYCSHSLGRVT